MGSLHIKKESLPTRCEICHQKDLFDPISNYCLRCKLSAKHYEQNFRRSTRTNNRQIVRYRKPISISELSFPSLVYILAASFVGGFVGFFLASFFLAPFLSSHSDDVWPIVLIPFSAILGQVALPFLMIMEKGNYSKIFFYLFSYSVVGAVTGFMSPIFFAAIKQHLFSEQNDFILHYYSSRNICKALMLGVMLGPILGISLPYIRNKIETLVQTK